MNVGVSTMSFTGCTLSAFQGTDGITIRSYCPQKMPVCGFQLTLKKMPVCGFQLTLKKMPVCGFQLTLEEDLPASDSCLRPSVHSVFPSLARTALGPVDILALSCSKQRNGACVPAAQSYKLTLDFWVIWGLKVSWASAWRCWGEGSR